MEVTGGSSSTNTNNVISDKDVNIELGFEKLEDQNFKVFEEAGEGLETIADSDKKREAERQEWLEKLEQERSEWEALESAQRTSTGGVKTTHSVSFTEVLQHFQTKTLDTKNIKPTINRTRFAAFLHFLFGPPKLHQSLVEERDLIFCIAQTQLDDGEDIHGRTLQTIYKKLTGSKFDCARRGTHWETIGFQGNDPATDLRGVGFLGLMQILHGTSDSDVSSLFTDFYRLSLDEEQNFPFCVMSFNITRIALQVLREEKLHKDCNKRKQVIAVVNDFYVALFLHVYTIWKTQHKTMKDSGHVMKDAETEAKKNPRKLLRKLESALKERQSNKKKLPASPVPISGPLTPDQRQDLHGRPSAASSLSSEDEDTGKQSNNQSLDASAPNSARFVATKKSSMDELEHFTDIQTEGQQEIPVTDL
ncbi:ELMO domain-containing protein 3-like [Styela clava]